MRARTRLAVACCFVLWSCGDTTAPASGDAGLADARNADGTPPGSDGGRSDATAADGRSHDGPLTRQEYCQGNGPLAIVADVGASSQEICTGKLAAVTFRYALCTCDGFQNTGTVRTDSFDSTAGAYNPASSQNGAGVGFNGKLDLIGSAAIGGPLIVGAGGVDLLSGMTVDGNLRCVGDIQATSDCTVSGDAAVKGNIGGVGKFTVRGKLTQPSGYAFTSLRRDVASHETATVDVPPPCDCAPEHVLDIAKLVQSYKILNDNAEVGLNAGKLDGYQGPTTLALPCGRFYLTGLRGTGSATLEVSGRTALFIGGKVSVAGDIKVVFKNDKAELDIFVENGMSSVGGLDLGDRNAPAKVRLYVGGTDPIQLTAAGAVVAGNLYAPKAQLTATGGLETFGSIFVRQLQVTGTVSIHYDRAVLDLARDCPPPGGGSSSGSDECTSCRDCGNQACIAGKCGQCRNDDDCCAPLRCVSGSCQAPVL